VPSHYGPRDAPAIPAISNPLIHSAIWFPHDSSAGDNFAPCFPTKIYQFYQKIVKMYILINKKKIKEVSENNLLNAQK